MERKPAAVERFEAQAHRRQLIAFCVLTLFVTAALLVLHSMFAALLGHPSRLIIVLLAGSLAAKTGEGLFLIQQKHGVSLRFARIETILSMSWIFLLTWILIVLTDRDDAPYFVLLAIPILQSAYHFRLTTTLATIAAAIGMIFGWAHHFYTLHPPARPTELLEAGMISLIYALMGVLVWYLVKQLGQKEAGLWQAISELDAARKQLTNEEKLAAVGSPPGFRTAREWLCRLRARARPAPHDERVPGRAQGRASCLPRRKRFEIDPFQVEGALENLVLNAIDATPDAGEVTLRTRMMDGKLLIDVENTGNPIPDGDLVRIFEPFFTTKQSGTGLGLAIAKGVARAHGGDLWVSHNESQSVTFTMSLAVTNTGNTQGGNEHGESPDRR